MAAHLVSTTINGDAVEFACPADESLLSVLRNRLGLSGAKEGCSTGDCGACSVTLNGSLVCMAENGKLHPLQENFIDHAALQCGICTPGFLIAAKVLLERNPDPTESEIRYALAGNLCRCTGYDKIVRAVQATAKELRQLEKKNSRKKNIKKS